MTVLTVDVRGTYKVSSAGGCAVVWFLLSKPFASVIVLHQQTCHNPDQTNADEDEDDDSRRRRRAAPPAGGSPPPPPDISLRPRSLFRRRRRRAASRRRRTRPSGRERRRPRRAGGGRGQADRRRGIPGGQPGRAPPGPRQDLRGLVPRSFLRGVSARRGRRVRPVVVRARADGGAAQSARQVLGGRLRQAVHAEVVRGVRAGFEPRTELLLQAFSIHR